jgi:hypothetical protein
MGKYIGLRMGREVGSGAEKFNQPDKFPAA